MKLEFWVFSAANYIFYRVRIGALKFLKQKPIWADLIGKQKNPSVPVNGF